MGCRAFPFDGPEKGKKNVCLYVEGPDHRPVFTALCLDIIRTLESSNHTSRIADLQFCFSRWSKFFERYGIEGLSQERQRGLFGELILLELLLKKGLDAVSAISSWKGCSGGRHDFVHKDIGIEVKTTLSKEPRKILVSSERQLDDAGLESLTLFILTLIQADEKGTSLPSLVNTIRREIEPHSNATFLFETDLIEAGYTDSDAAKYSSGYLIKKSEAFRVKEGFPRIISMAPGVGDVVYSVSVSACNSYEMEMDLMLEEFTGRKKDG